MTDAPRPPDQEPPPPPPGEQPPPPPEQTPAGEQPRQPWQPAEEEPLPEEPVIAGPVGAGIAAEVDESAVAGESERDEPEDRFRTFVAIAIAVVSILGAIVAFTGTLAAQSASQLDETGIEDTANQQQIITNLSATVEEDVRNLAPYQEDVKAAGILQSQAATLQSSDPSAAALLQAQAQSYQVLARAQSAFFRGEMPGPGSTNGPVNYDPRFALNVLENRDSQLSQLKPDATIAQADSKHSQSVNLVGLVTLFIAALLFLTLAQFTRPAIRRVFAAAGGIIALVAVILWIFVLVLSS